MFADPPRAGLGAWWGIPLAVASHRMSILQFPDVINWGSLLSVVRNVAVEQRGSSSSNILL